MRLQQACTACSTTPRTGKARVEELARLRGHIDEQLYEEAKLCLNRGNVEDALALFRLCPPGYRNASQYIAQCLQHGSMCEGGILHRPEAEAWRVALAEALSSPPRALAVARYAERLYKDGFSPAHVSNLRLVDAMAESADMTAGHRAALEEYASAHTAWHERVCVQVERAATRCRFDAVLREARPWLTSTPPASATTPE